MPAPDWYDGVTLEILLPKILGRACWGTAVRLVRERQNLVRPADADAQEAAAFVREAPESTPLQRRAALALAEVLEVFRR